MERATAVDRLHYFTPPSPPCPCRHGLTQKTPHPSPRQLTLLDTRDLRRAHCLFRPPRGYALLRYTAPHIIPPAHLTRSRNNQTTTCPPCIPHCFSAPSFARMHLRFQRVATPRSPPSPPASEPGGSSSDVVPSARFIRCANGPRTGLREAGWLEMMPKAQRLAGGSDPWIAHRREKACGCGEEDGSTALLPCLALPCPALALAIFFSSSPASLTTRTARW